MPIEDAYATRSVNGVRVSHSAQPHPGLRDDRPHGHALKELAESAAEERFLLDFDRVASLSSSDLGMLLGLQRRIVQRPAA